MTDVQCRCSTLGIHLVRWDTTKHLDGSVKGTYSRHNLGLKGLNKTSYLSIQHKKNKHIRVVYNDFDGFSIASSLVGNAGLQRVGIMFRFFLPSNMEVSVAPLTSRTS